MNGGITYKWGDYCLHPHDWSYWHDARKPLTWLLFIVVLMASHYLTFQLGHESGPHVIQIEDASGRVGLLCAQRNWMEGVR
jgi:hypothetical protein